MTLASNIHKASTIVTCNYIFIWYKTGQNQSQTPEIEIDVGELIVLSDGKTSSILAKGFFHSALHTFVGGVVDRNPLASDDGNK